MLSVVHGFKNHKNTITPSYLKYLDNKGMRGPTLYKNVLTVIDELQGKNSKLPLSSQISFRKKNAYGSRKEF
jgi:hypothetical protein